MNQSNSATFQPTLESPGQAGHPTMPSFDFQGIKESIKHSIKQGLISMPIVTCSIFGLCLLLYTTSSIFYLTYILSDKKYLIGWDRFGESYFSLSPDAIIRNYEVWRLFTYPYFHLSFFHILFNLLAVIPMSGTFERRTGSVQYFLYLITAFTLIPSIVYCLFSLIPMSFFTSLPSVAGLSGLFFTLLVWQATEYPSDSSFCGLCNVRPEMYPLLFLLIITIIFPSASFLGHFLGLWVGYLYIYNILRFLEIRPDIILKIENTNPVLFIKNKFPTRFANYDSRGFSLAGAPILPIFHSTNPNDNEPTSGSGYHVPFFQNQGSMFGFGSNSNANIGNQGQSGPFSGQGRRLGG